MIRAIAIDDEPPALQVLQHHAAQVDSIQLEAVFTNATEGIAYLQTHPIELIFLDIQMPDINGMEIATLYKDKVQVIFTTAFSKYASKGFDLDATDYLLKPISFTRFVQACRKIKDKQEPGSEPSDLFLRNNNEWLRISPSDIQYIAAQGNYLKIITAKQQCLIRQTLQEIEQTLPSSFCRVHKSYIVNIKHIDRIEPHQVTIGFTGIPVSAGFKNKLFNRLGLKNSTSTLL